MIIGKLCNDVKGELQHLKKVKYLCVKAFQFQFTTVLFDRSLKLTQNVTKRKKSNTQQLSEFVISLKVNILQYGITCRF